MTSRRALIACLALAAASTRWRAALAQNHPPKVLLEEQVTPDALEALKLSPKETEDIKTKRSLRVVPDGSGPSARPVGPAGTGAAPPPTAPGHQVALLITFVTNSAVLSARARKALDVVAQTLKSKDLADLRFTVEGHADPRGTHRGNLVLSQSRADSVRGYLIETQGIDPGRLFAVGRGDTELMNKRVPTAAENRRVTLATRLD